MQAYVYASVCVDMYTYLQVHVTYISSFLFESCANTVDGQACEFDDASCQLLQSTAKKGTAVIAAHQQVSIH